MPKTVGGNTCHPWGGTDSSGSPGALVSLATWLKVFLQWHRGTGKSFSKGWILVYLLLPGAFWGSMANTTSPLLKIHLPFFLTDPTLISFRVAMCQEKKSINNYVLLFLQLGWHPYGKGDTSISQLGLSGKVLLSWNRRHHPFLITFSSLSSSSFPEWGHELEIKLSFCDQEAIREIKAHRSDDTAENKQGDLGR